MTTPAITLARQAIWSVVDNYAELNPSGVSVFSRKVVNEDDVGRLQNSQTSGIRDFMAMEVQPVRTTPEWLTHRMQQADYMLTIQLTGLRLLQLEDVVEKLIRGLYQSAPDAGAPAQTYVKIATGYNPHSYDIAWTKTKLGNAQNKVTAWLVTINLGLRYQVDPFGAVP